MKEFVFNLDGSLKINCILDLDKERLYVKWNDFYDVLNVADVSSQGYDDMLSSDAFSEDYTVVYYNNNMWVDIAAMNSALCISCDEYIGGLLLDSLISSLYSELGNLRLIVKLCLNRINKV